MGLLKDIFGLFMPPVCAMCGETLPETVGFVCTRCRWEMPLTGFCRRFDNPVAHKFHGLVPVVNASAFMWFSDGSDVRKMIHDFKYRGSWRYARKSGEWYGSELRESGFYSDVDVIVPIPLHIRKLLKRGYNQSEYIAEGISVSMGVPVDVRSVTRRRHTKSQTERTKNDRWENVEGIFAVRRSRALSGKHILLVDDVLTTGATMVSCAQAILDAVPDCRISIAALAASRAEYGDFK